MTKKRETVAQLWEKIFSDYDILEAINHDKVFKISADVIRQYKEPRLMTKFDFNSTLPEVFRKNQLGILPIDNGEYIIGHFKLYQKLPKTPISIVNEMSLPSFLTTIDPDNIYSEANALHAANASGILRDFIGSELVETISGRMRPEAFDLNVTNLTSDGKYQISINKPQIEIDGGYESFDNVVLIEAKNKLSDDFIIRQLYYPYRYWSNKTHKAIRNLFMVYDNSVYSIYEYHFSDLFDYNSLELIKSKNYSIKYPKLIPMLKELIGSITPTIDDNSTKIPFLQANSMNSVIKVISEVDSNNFTTQEVADILEYDIRQGSYYVAANRYLELIEPVGNAKYRLTPLGARIKESSNVMEINKIFISQLAKHPIFHDAIANYASTEQVQSNDYYASLIRKHIAGLSESTVIRRSSTLQSWMRWIAGSNV